MHYEQLISILENSTEIQPSDPNYSILTIIAQHISDFMVNAPLKGIDVSESFASKYKFNQRFREELFEKCNHLATPFNGVWRKVLNSFDYISDYVSQQLQETCDY